MTTSTIFSIDLGNVKMASRTSGQQALERVLAALQRHDKIALDFGHRPATPSFVDQCMGGLITQLGAGALLQRVKLVNVAESERALIRHVLARRQQQASPPAAATGQTAPGQLAAASA